MALASESDVWRRSNYLGPKHFDTWKGALKSFSGQSKSVVAETHVLSSLLSQGTKERRVALCRR
jgi:hypothetical protein